MLWYHSMNQTLTLTLNTVNAMNETEKFIKLLLVEGSCASSKKLLMLFVSVWGTHRIYEIEGTKKKK